MNEGAIEPDKPPQGWFVDPFGEHEQRWFSQGSPTALVRDGRAESQDPPPAPVYTGTLVRGTAPDGPDPAGGDRVSTDGRDREVAEAPRPDAVGDPAGAGEAGTPPVAGAVAHRGRLVSPRTDGTPVTPKRVLRTRWVALIFSIVWTLLLAGLFLSATTTTTAHGHAHSQSILSTNPAGVLSFIAMVVVAVGVTGFGFVRRVRAESSAPSRTGYVFAGILGLLGLLSLATIGLALVILAVALAVVARPLQTPRPLPGERVARP